MKFEREAAPLRRRPPFPLPAVVLCAAVGAAFAQVGAGPSARMPAQLSLSAEPGTLATATFAIANEGAAGSRLAFEITPSSTSCDAPSPAPWLVVEPAAGMIEAGTVASCSVYASAFASAMPRRTGFLCVATNEAARPLQALQVALAIAATPGR